MSVGKSSISRISKKETAPATEEVKVEAPKAEAKTPAKKTTAPAKKATTAVKSVKSAKTTKTAPKSAPKTAPKKAAAPKPAAPKKVDTGAFKIYQVTDELPYYLL
jgi:hypothetical protein